MAQCVLDALPYIVFVKDRSRVYRQINRAGVEFFGRPATEIIGALEDDLFPLDVAAAVAEVDRIVIDAGRPVTRTERWRRTDGQERLLEITKQPLLDSAGAVIGLVGSARDITDREPAGGDSTGIAQSALPDVAEQERRIRLLTDNLPAMINYFSVDDRIIFCNKQYAELFGFSRDAAIGKHLVEVIGQETYDSLQAELTAVKSGQELCYERSVGRRTYRITLRPASDEQGAVHGVYALLLDVTEQKKLAGELSAALARAEVAGIAKDQFLANVSHEIRTPMNAIIGLTELLLRTRLDEGQRDYLQKSHRSALLLLGLLNDVLDFSKIQAGHLKLDPHRFRVADVLEQISALYRDAAHEQGLEFIIAPAPDLPEALVGDSLRLTQVISNLCSNAIKCTSRGEVVGRVGCTADVGEDANDTVQLEVAVSDTGIGMTPEQAARIFEPFSQADGSTTRRFGGTGLGLSICCDLLELMGSRLELEAYPERGSRFHFAVSLKRPGPDDAETTAGDHSHSGSAAARAELEGRRILVVDDYSLNLEIVTAFLQDARCLVTVAHHGREALEHLRHEVFDAVLMDVQMPVMDGYEATRAIRQQAQWRDLPVIAMTANVMESDREKCFAVGMNDFIPKPVMVDVLLTCLARNLKHLPDVLPNVLQDSTSPGVMAEAASDAELDVDQLFGIDVDVALQSTMGQMGFLARVLQIFVDTQADFGAHFSAARASELAASEDAREAPGRLAHTLKGAAASIGAESLRQAALALEQASKQGAADAVVKAALDAVLRELQPVLDGILRALKKPAS